MERFVKETFSEQRFVKLQIVRLSFISYLDERNPYENTDISTLYKRVYYCMAVNMLCIALIIVFLLIEAIFCGTWMLCRNKHFILNWVVENNHIKSYSITYIV